MRKLIVMAIVVGMGMAIMQIGVKQALSSDEFVRRTVVKLDNPKKGSCTGEAVRAKSGKVYTLTAAHCREILNNDKTITAIREDGSKFTAKLVMYDAGIDVMLLTSPETIALPMAKGIYRHEKVHSITRGGGHDSFREDGEYMEEILAHIPTGLINEMADRTKCLREPNHTIIDTFMGSLCVAHMKEIVTTMHVTPGSSGGAVLNDAGEVIGVVSAGQEDGLSLIVPYRLLSALMERY